MHDYDYSFLKSFPLPDNLSALLGCLRDMQAEYASTQDSPVKAPDFGPTPIGLREAYLSSEADPLLLVPCVTLDALCGLPDAPKSRHIAAALALELLCQKGYTMCRYFPLEEAMSRYLYFHQRSLDRARAHWEQNGSDYLCYIEMFLSLLYLCGKGLPAVPAAPRRGAKRAAIEALVLGSGTPISKAEICAALPDISPTTVEAALGAMVRSGKVKKVGAARAARYIKA